MIGVGDQSLFLSGCSSCRVDVLPASIPADDPIRESAQVIRRHEQPVDESGRKNAEIEPPPGGRFYGNWQNNDMAGLV